MTGLGYKTVVREREGNIADLVRKAYAAYETKDRQVQEDLIDPDFTFTSPYDDHIDRATYFERCWPNSTTTKAINIEKLFVKGDEAFVRYELERYDGTGARNTEFLRFKDGKIVEVDVYFGRDLPDAHTRVKEQP